MDGAATEYTGYMSIVGWKNLACHRIVFFEKTKKHFNYWN